MNRIHLVAISIACIAVSCSARADAVSCTVTLEACGALEQNLTPLTRIKEGVCLKADLAEFGNRPSGLHYTAVVWIGVSVSGDTLVFGKGEAKAGILLKCSWSPRDPEPAEQLRTLKSSLPQLLKNNRFQKHFPGVARIDASKLIAVENADARCAEALAEFAASY